MPDVINSIQISGKILDEPKLRRPDNRKLAVLSFTAETIEKVGRAGRIEPVRWRAKIFGPAAEQAARDLGREIHIVAVGRVSGYEGAADTRAGKKKKTRRNDVDVVIDIHKYAVLPTPVIVSEVGLVDGGDFVDL